MGRFTSVTILFGIILFVSLLMPQAVSAKDDAVHIYFFYSDTCPHCAKEKDFLQRVEDIYGDQIAVHRYEVNSSPQNQILYQEFAAAHTQSVTGVPATFIGSRVVVGYTNDETTGDQLEQIITECLSGGSCPDTLALIRGETTETDEPAATDTDFANTSVISLPIFGDIDTSTYSLFGLTAVIAAVDGFNPCAMWVLLILIGLLLGMQNRKRMWVLGLTFIGASAAVYFLFLAAWLEIFRFVGMVRWLQILIGVGAMSIGAYYLRRFTKMKPGQCAVTNPDQRRKITDRIKHVVHERALWIALPGIIGVAFIVNLIELMCSAGLPAIYTQVLSLTELSRWSYYSYLLLYVVIFVLDDIFVFVLAMVTMKAVGTEGRFNRWATLVGGVVIVALGILLVLNPQLLSFGL